MGEVRNAYEGTLRWVQASGSGVAWATASAPVSGLIGYVTNVTFTSGAQVAVISNRGIPSHQKMTQKDAPTLNFDIQWGNTGDYPSFLTTGSGASVPMVHMELKSTAPEAGAGIYHQFHGCARLNTNFTESNPANTQSWSLQALAMNGPTASGFLG